MSGNLPAVTRGNGHCARKVRKAPLSLKHIKRAFSYSFSREFSIPSKLGACTRIWNESDAGSLREMARIGQPKSRCYLFSSFSGFEALIFEILYDKAVVPLFGVLFHL